MSTSSSTPISSIPWRMIGSAAGIIGMLLLLLLAVPKSEVPVVNPEDEIVVVDSTAADCEQDLTRIMTAMRPGSQGVTADRLELVNQLNHWLDTCGKLEDAQAQIVRDADLLKKLLPAEELDWVNRSRFLGQDSSHIRMCFLAQAIVNAVALPEKTDRTRVVKLFDFVMKNVGFVPDNLPDTPPLSPYESLLFGRGTAEQQAWVFATLLKQLRLDAVILRQAGVGKANNWLLAVIVPRSGVFLFDTRLGMLIPTLQKGDGAFWPQIPATIEEARTNDQVFRQLDVPNGPAYPWTADDLTRVSVELIGDPSGWSPRMAKVQYLLAAEFTVDLYDGLGSNDLRQPGLWDRVRETGATAGWTEADMQLWTFPGEQLAQLEQTLSTEGNVVTSSLQVFSGPIVIKEDRVTGMLKEGPIDPPLHKVRINQLLGEHAQAVKDYVPIRSQGVKTQIPLNQQAADHAEFWIGVSQFELGRYEPAFHSFERYLQARPSGGVWSGEAIQWINRCLLATNQQPAAGQLLSQNMTTERLCRDAYLLRRWAQLLGLTPEVEKKSTPATDTPSAPAATQPAATPAETATDSTSPAPSTDSPERAVERPPAPAVPEALSPSAPEN